MNRRSFWKAVVGAALAMAMPWRRKKPVDYGELAGVCIGEIERYKAEVRMMTFANTKLVHVKSKDIKWIFSG